MVFGISVQDLESHRKFAEEGQLNFPLLADPGRNLTTLYGTTEKLEDLSKRVTFVIDKEGIIRLIDKKVQVATHGLDLLHRLQEMAQDK